jgi:6-phosphogluconolactonase
MNWVVASCADGGALVVLRLDATSGRLETRQTLDGLGMVMPLALRADGRVLYAGRRSAPMAVLAFARDAEGRLSPLGEAPLPASMAHLAVDGTGRWLLAASYQGDQLAVLALDADGRPGAVVQSLATGRHAHALKLSRDNRFAYAAILGAGELLQFAFDAATGRLAPLDPPAWKARPGAGPRHLAWHPTLAQAVLLNELDGTLARLAHDDARGGFTHLQTVSILPPGFAGEPWSAELRCTPDGRFLYASERRSSTLAGFAVAADGALTPIGHWPTQAQPRGFAVDATSRWLVAAGQQSNRLGVHAIDAATGALSPGMTIDVPANPNWVEITDLPP